MEENKPIEEKQPVEESKPVVENKAPEEIKPVEKSMAPVPAAEGPGLDIAKCFTDALDVYKRNLPILILSALIFQLMSLFTLLILAGPLFGGYALMLLKAMRKEDKKVEMNDMFKELKRFWPLLGLFFLQGVFVFAGFMALIIPGIVLSTMWIYTYFFMVDKNESVIGSLKASWKLVKEKGFWINCTLVIIYLIFSIVPSQVPFIGWLVNFFALPFALLLLASGYMQQVKQ